MFEILSEKLAKVFRLLGAKGRLTEKDIDEGLRQVRLALLEADVNFKVVKDFIARVRERSLGAEVQQSLTPGQQIVKIVNEELIAILGGEPSRLATSSQPPSVVMLVGLQGSGKTTTAAKLANHLKHSGQRPLLVAADNRRPAAIEQLVTLGGQLEVPVYHESASVPSEEVCAHALAEARSLAASWVIVDTAGRLHIDEAMMAELARVKQVLRPGEILLVVDAMTGQDAVRSAEEFHSRVGLTGLILTKMDGDARGGAALSIRWVSGVPIKFIGTGEKLDALEPFYPDRLASRILGMGDILTFIERAEATLDAQQAKALQKKVQTATFDLEDFLSQLRAIKKMGPLAQLMEMLPGVSQLASRLPEGTEEKQLKKVEAIILSMTPEERRNPSIIGGSRRRRIARGSGTSASDINRLLNQFHQMRKLMKLGAKGKLPRNLAGLFG
ncbi:MAG TPA: signal recognition particle protein [Dehalococcoidia bacterium]|jgi:signal recognition particle subunit SRP54|nr:signal recognition particle protein [Dehalococcoidia bacterium]